MIENWNLTAAEGGQVAAIARRAVMKAYELGHTIDRMEMDMDLTACHLNGCRLDLAALLAAPDPDFCHDVFGIRRHIDRTTGKLGDCFWPRYAARQVAP